MNKQDFLAISDKNSDERLTSRRRFLRQLACGTLLAACAPGMASAAVRHVYGLRSYKAIALENIHTGDKLNVVYFEQGRFVPGALAEINHLFRDYYTGDIHPIDPMLLEQLHDLRNILDVNRPFQVVSGYRSPYTNSMLRRESHGVARHSLHMEGRAIDIRIGGVATKHIKNAAVALQRGGVGYYPKTNFVHLDTGEVRLW